MTGTKLRIASYNIRKARGLDQKRNPGRTLEVINRLDADIVLLQEADKRLGMRKPALPPAMIEAETDFRLLEVSRNGVSLGWHGNAVLLRDGLEVTDVDHIELPGTEPRGAVRFHLSAGQGLTVFAAHLGLMRRDRRAQLKVLSDKAADAPHAVIAGDFNEWSKRRGLEPLAKSFDTFAPGRSFHARRPMAALDRFALSKGLELRDGGVEQGTLARIASDHLPVWTDIRVPAAPAIC
ncbi:endonuclease/exonuclease/phosphatase family protein [Marimonas sp. MJW-29]|uniref:Endonuclease/exonuclease/phosphatase family protein n=1 Tax=Sulfitobacter sediminis TaxID=3234186 RepID=A0ABV3RQW7_9RHOB